MMNAVSRWKRRMRIAAMPTDVIRATLAAFDRPILRWLFVETIVDCECELLARDLAAIAEETGGWPVCPVTGLQ